MISHDEKAFYSTAIFLKTLRYGNTTKRSRSIKRLNFKGLNDCNFELQILLPYDLNINFHKAAGMFQNFHRFCFCNFGNIDNNDHIV